MTDIVTTADPNVVTVPDAIETPAEAAPVETEAPAEKAPRTRKAPEPRVCACSWWVLLDDQNDVIDTTECDKMTGCVFAQGHDARLVSFVVGGHLDGYRIGRRTDDEDAFDIYSTPADAAGTISAPLRAKAENATANGLARIEAKKAKADDRETARAARESEKAAKIQERAAAKAAKAQEKADLKAKQDAVKAAAKVSSVEGDFKSSIVSPEPVEGEELVKIKVGRWEYEGVLSADKTEIRYLDNQGAEQVRKADEVRILTEA